MKLKFESNLEHQNKAVKAVIDVLDGIKTKTGQFEAYQNELTLWNSDINYVIGEANEIINDNWMTDVVSKNIQQIAENNDIGNYYPTDQKVFDIEMETGTGKTYVFLKTIFELHKNYGFKKFIIVVPSLAIKEGVKKTLAITKSHFKDEYNQEYDYYEYDSDSVRNIKDFIDNNFIQIMIMNIQQFNKFSDEGDKKNNNIYKPNEGLEWESPISLIQKTKPIIIIDEPQSTDSGIKSKKGIENLSPLFTLRYSATFREKDRCNLLYRLDACDAYDLKLVKKIILKSHKVIKDNKLIALVKCSNKNNKITCTLRIDGKEKTFSQNDNIYDCYNDSRFKNNYIIDEICLNSQKVVFLNGETLFLEDENDESYLVLKTDQIKSTIKFHLDKQLDLLNKKIKVLSLFFIDKVANYREYDSENNPVLGRYAKIFEEKFVEIASQEKYKPLFAKKNINEIVKKIHDGYFSKDKKNCFKDTKGNSDDDVSTYDKIMKDKERLLSFDEPLAFIFSHSALAEGWDNPNVFQICVLTSSKSEIKKRQQIGRGLRLCVNDNGERVYDENINRLSICTNIEYEEFVENLQKEMKEAGVQFRSLTPKSFVKINYSESDSQKIYLMCKNNSFINSNGEIIPKNFIKDTFVDKMNKEFEGQLHYDDIIKVYEFIRKDLPIINYDNLNKSNKLKKEVLYSEEFITLWNSINQKTVYKVKFDSDEFIKNTQVKIKKEISNNNRDHKKITIESKTAVINQSREEGVKAQKIETGQTEYESKNLISSDINDIVSDIEKETRLTKKTIARILNDDEIIDFIKNNPHDFDKKLKEIINNTRNELMVNGIEYTKIDNEKYALSLFEENSLNDEFADGDNRYLPVVENQNKYPFEHVKTDSDIEKKFAKDALMDDNNKVFVKIPSWFKIHTPLGNYNPDWAIYKEVDKKIVFVAETKGSTNEKDLRSTEKNKIKCGQKHFKSLDTNVEFKTVTNYEDL